MPENHVCAVIVTFRPGSDLGRNLKAILPQVEDLVVVDNGSSDESLIRLRDLKNELGFHLIENGRNLGIATALNIGVQWAQQRRAQWIALFDQDSCVADNFMRIVLQAYDSAADRHKIGLVSGRFRGAPVETDHYVTLAITSGSVVPIQTFEKCGLFEEPLFIDCVDDEFCLRIQRMGYKILMTGQKVLFHALGEPTPFRFLWVTSTTANYGARRRYYRNRNRVYLVLRYWNVHPLWCKNTIVVLVKELLKIVIAEKDKNRKLAYSFYGYWHGLIGKMGNVVKL